MLLAGSASAAKLYRWVDEDGRVHYSDKVPPQAMQGEHSQLNERGIMVQRQEAVKSAEELAKEQEVERLRREQQQLIREQQERDQALLRTFRTEDDLILTRDGKLAAVDAQIQLSQSNIKRLKRQLVEMQETAATMEKQGRQISQQQRDDIATTQQQIEDTYASILRREKEKEQITADFESDLKRFRELRNLSTDTEPPAPRDRPAVFLDTLVTCASAAQCDRAWEKAKAYVRQHATTRVQIDADRIMMTAPPKRNEGLSLTISRVPLVEGEGERIFLDVQCRETALGQEFCRSEAITEIRAGFRPLLLAVD
jgi:hypothetical protein